MQNFIYIFFIWLANPATLSSDLLMLTEKLWSLTSSSHTWPNISGFFKCLIKLRQFCVFAPKFKLIGEFLHAVDTVQMTWNTSPFTNNVQNVSNKQALMYEGEKSNYSARSYFLQINFKSLTSFSTNYLQHYFKCYIWRFIYRSKVWK